MQSPKLLEEPNDGIKIYSKEQLDMDKDNIPKNKAPKPKKEKDNMKNTLSVYTYTNWKRFGLSVAIDNGIKVNILIFETHIKFEKR